MTTLELQGRITEKGDLEIHLPPGLPAVEVRVRIDLPDVPADTDTALSQQPWTDEEILALTTPRRKTMKEAMAWLEAHPATEEWGGMKPEDDPAEFIHNLRRQNQIVLEDPEESE